RGFQGALLRLETAALDAHSGLLGGPAPNPLLELCEVVVSCVDARTGEVLVPGFYDEVESPAPNEIEELLAAGMDLHAFARAYGVRRLRANGPSEFLRRLWLQPTFELHGLAGGYQGPGIKSIIPHAAEAKISMRLVPRQEPDEILSRLRAHVARINADV